MYSPAETPVSLDSLARVELSALKRMLKGPLAVVGKDREGVIQRSTGVQTAGVLDDIYHYDGPLGASFSEADITIRVWAPSAQQVKLHLFHGEMDSEPAAILPMREQEKDGVWSAAIESSWTGRYYLFEVTVYVPALEQMVNNLVTDPYSADLAVNGIKTRLTNLDDASHKPPGWHEHQTPALASVNDLSIYELHVRDFSARDESVRADWRGTYLAFTDPQTNGMRHLRDLANAGMKAIHLLPTFHIASIDEEKARWLETGDLTGFAPDSEEQQKAVAAIQDQDAYNWGYDPVHYCAPAGAYAFDPARRVMEYRQMVQALHGIGLRVIQDVVFNHTSACGQSQNSVLDKIVPGYYYRLDANGKVLNSSCCCDTASEHRMMEKLMVDALTMQARHYRIDGFRFDLMGFHFTYNLERIQKALAAEGREVYLYGEGWEMGETAKGALGPNASQSNMFGTGIGTFNDSLRDAVRGGSPLEDARTAGFATGATNVKTLKKSTLAIRAGLAGNLRAGREPGGYTAAPAENIIYVSAHDNETIFDAIQMNSPADDTMEQRVRRAMLANSIVALGQGIPFFQAGDDLLRSKSLDRNSYNSGDWFNALDFTFQRNNWGLGLPMASENERNWPWMRRLLANPAWQVTPAMIELSRRVFQEFLRIRYSSPLFRLRSAEEIRQNVQFLETDLGVIAMALNQSEILAVLNATRFAARVKVSVSLKLHPVQAESADAVVRSAAVNSIPALTTAVFVKS